MSDEDQESPLYAELPTYQVNVEWPATTHLHAAPANIYTFTDDGKHVYLAFGFVPPPPHGKTPVENFEVHPSGSFQLDRNLVLQIRDQLSNFIERNPLWFTSETVTDNDSTS